MKALKLIRTRLIVTPAIAGVALIVTAAISLIAMNNDYNALSVSQINSHSMTLEKQAEMGVDALRGDVFAALVTGPSGLAVDRNTIKADVAAHIASFKVSIKALSDQPLTPAIKKTVDETTAAQNDYIATANELATLALTDTPAATAKLPQFRLAYLTLKKGLTQIRSLQEAISDVDSNAREAALFSAIQLLGFCVVVSIIAVVASAWFAARSITRPIQRVKHAMKDISSGNLNLSVIDIENEGEIGEIARSLDGLREKLIVAVEMDKERNQRQADLQAVTVALSVGLQGVSRGDFTHSLRDPFDAEFEALRGDFNLTLDRLNEVITKVVAAAESIRSRSAEVSRASDDMAQRTETLAATLEQTAAAMDEMTSSVKSAAQNTKEVEGIARDARKEAEACGATVKDTVNAMVEIEKSSDQISQIIGVIDDIAFQTNLLALNAGVEAARAGDAGRGFAVVASEVGALAQRSSAAAKEIKTLIGTSTRHVGLGVDQVGLAGAALTKIVDRVTQISNLISNIATSAGEQSMGLMEINIGVTQLDQTTQQNAALVEETAATSQLLKRDADDLTELMAQFSITKPEVAAPSGLIEINHPALRPPTSPPQPSPSKVSGMLRPLAVGNDDAVWQNF